MATLETRLAVLEARDAVTSCLNRYLDLCDVPGPLQSPDQIGELFTENAVWEGIGSAHASRFGAQQGRAAIQEMVSGFLPPVEHFRRNSHHLATGHIETQGDTASGRWLMIQLSGYTDGTADLLAARLTVDFHLHPRTDVGPRVLISHFRTERMFDAKVAP
ncbi:nuclear transport factor 2 family protein [Janibacter sp. GS2]|uniref:nuclear transport factor 2 family protein n=1 Tax=Janibacter sp. GS2 TaxID=3442646 RepID=UPI003EBCBBD4